jgi:hypothetical protein
VLAGWVVVEEEDEEGVLEAAGAGVLELACGCWGPAAGSLGVGVDVVAGVVEPSGAEPAGASAASAPPEKGPPRPAAVSPLPVSADRNTRHARRRGVFIGGLGRD